MKIDIDSWKGFKVSDIFICQTTKAVDTSLVENGAIPYITRSRDNNGCSGYFECDENINKGNCITIGAEGGVAYYQKDDFVAGVKVYVLRNESLNALNAMFLITVLNRLTYLYSYGRARVLEKIKNEIIKLPVDSNTGLPDYDLMERFITSLNHKPIITKVEGKDNALGVNIQGEFKLKDIFNLEKGKRLTKADMVSGNLNYIGAISENNGVRECIDVDHDKIKAGNCITVNYNGSVGEAFYQAEPFWASDDVNILYPKDWDMNKYNALYIVTVIKLNRYMFSYGRKWTLEKMKESVIKLPITKNGLPDFGYMEQYMKSLLYSDRI